MSLFDNLAGLASSLLGGGSMEQALPDLLSKALGQTDLGNIGGLLTQLQGGGLGEHVSSWLSTGANMAVSPDQISSALGSGQLGQLAQSVGLDQSQITEALAKYLPGLIDKMSPNGVLETT